MFPKAKNEPPMSKIPWKLSTTQVPEANVAPVDGRLAEITPAGSIRTRNPVGPLIPNEFPATTNEPSGSGWRRDTIELSDSKTVETPAVAKVVSSTPVVLSYRATVALLGGGPFIPPPPRSSLIRRYMWDPANFASRMSAFRVKTPLLPKPLAKVPFALNFVIVDVRER